MNANIQSEENTEGGRFYLPLPPDEAEITYLNTPDQQLRICNHTGVPEQHRGQGIAFQLVEHLVDDARKNKLHYVPLCPYVAEAYSEHPEWSDVFVLPKI